MANSIISSNFSKFFLSKVADLANKNTRHPVKFAFQTNYLFLVEVCSEYCMGYTAWYILPLKINSVFIWNSNIDGQSVFNLATLFLSHTHCFHIWPILNFVSLLGLEKSPGEEGASKKKLLLGKIHIGASRISGVFGAVPCITCLGTEVTVWTQLHRLDFFPLPTPQT